ncbi:hypothetical protein PFDG_03242 [Plasmodium falciparum Dd2]|uniref:Uncharacterized protein n=1 Tax=Plasmodium falciparum (isolate Dd2) TaxID=57267 RepID=A0A0L7M3F1_PLAF4|nr:hypothetical protein PFDG_03242 [Plasmodium falciparum Dd2]
MNVKNLKQLIIHIQTRTTRRTYLKMYWFILMMIYFLKNHLMCQPKFLVMYQIKCLLICLLMCLTIWKKNLLRMI